MKTKKMPEELTNVVHINTASAIRDICDSEGDIDEKLDALLRSIVIDQEDEFEDVFDPSYADQDIGAQMQIDDSGHSIDDYLQRDVWAYHNEKDELEAIDDPELLKLLERLDNDEGKTEISLEWLDSQDLGLCFDSFRHLAKFPVEKFFKKVPSRHLRVIK
jgi:hypothetical protein